MSIGIGAHAKIIAEDEYTVIYEYGGYNLNHPEYRNAEHICDGIIMIQKRCFVEPEIHEKLKKMPSGKKKLISKRIPVSVDYAKMIEEGQIVVENCSNCWKTREENPHIDVMAGLLLFYIFLRYQEKGEIPESVSCNK